MYEVYPTLTALFTDIADAIRETTGDTDLIIADDFPDVIRDSLQVKPYLTFKSPNSFTLAVNDTTKHWDGTLQYSTDASTWSTWDGTTTLSSTTNGSSNVLYLRGIGNTVITGNSTDYKWVFTGSSIKCIGNIENLLDYATVASGNHPMMAEYCYRALFYNCTSLARAPALPATTLAEHCYGEMFQGCTGLTKAPALPATTLADYCYYNMFRDCTALTQAPVLPATTLAKYCYMSMFYGCTSLTQVPELPATTLAQSCYHFMFAYCTSLAIAPALPATTLADWCYKHMFVGCTALTQAPELPATTLAEYCYYYMFNRCTSLTKAPELPATTLANYCYGGMFNRCTSLTKAPSMLPATTLAKECYGFMFEFTAITSIPRIMATTYATDSCKGMFDDIKTLNVYSSSGEGHTYGWIAPASTYCSVMFGSDDGESEWAKLDGSNFPNGGTPTEGVTYYFATVD